MDIQGVDGNAHRHVAVGGALVVADTGRDPAPDLGLLPVTLELGRRPALPVVGVEGGHPQIVRLRVVAGVGEQLAGFGQRQLGVQPGDRVVRRGGPRAAAGAWALTAAAAEQPGVEPGQQRGDDDREGQRGGADPPAHPAQARVVVEHRAGAGQRGRQGGAPPTDAVATLDEQQPEPARGPE